MSKYRNELAKMGLPRTLFDEGFAEQLEQKLKRVDEMRQLVAEIEESEEWKSVKLPWTRQKDLPKDDLTVFDAICLVTDEKSVVTKVHKRLRNTMHIKLPSSLGSAATLRKSWERGVKPRSPDSKAYWALVRLGLDPEKPGRLGQSPHKKK